MIFGIHPGGAAGDDQGGLAVGPPDDPARITALLDRLQPAGRPFLVRCYTAFTGDAPTHAIATPAGATGYARRGRTLDLVTQYRSRSGDVDLYAAFVADLVTRFGASTSTLQITPDRAQHPRGSIMRRPR